MTKGLKVKILKSAKDTPYPDHIIVEKTETSEMAHLYFDYGKLVKFVYIQKEDEPIQMQWNEQEKRYMADPSHNPYKVKATYDVCKNKYLSEAPFANGCVIPTSFCTFKFSRPWKESTITFLDQPRDDRFVVLMNLWGKCKLNQYTEEWGADVKTIYPHQKRRTCPTPAFIKKERT